MAEEAAGGGGAEDWERQRVFYDTVRESIVSRTVNKLYASRDGRDDCRSFRYACWCS